MTITNSQQAIVNTILSSGGAIFGGFVRDYIANVAPEDIDCFIPVSGYLKLLSTLSTFGKLTSVGELGIAYNKEGIGSRWTFSDSLEGEHTQIDIVISGSKNLPDCDVNRLLLNNAGISVMPRCGNPKKLLEIVTHIHQRVFVPEKGISTTRYDKILEKGYKQKPCYQV